MSIAWRKIRQSIVDKAPKAVLAFSGGVDSVFLLDLIRDLPIKITLAHFDHGVGHEDVKIIKHYADLFGLELVCGKAKNLPNNNFEALAREQRYEFLHAVLNETGSDKILLGHHRDDLVETVFLRLFRGVPLTEVGMYRETSTLYRPLLDVPKDIIVSQAKHKKLMFHDDPSNQDMKYHRNWLRNDVIPKLSEKMNISEAVYKSWLRSEKKLTA